MLGGCFQASSPAARGPRRGTYLAATPETRPGGQAACCPAHGPPAELRPGSVSLMMMAKFIAAAAAAADDDDVLRPWGHHGAQGARLTLSTLTAAAGCAKAPGRAKWRGRRPRCEARFRRPPTAEALRPGAAVAAPRPRSPSPLTPPPPPPPPPPRPPPLSQVIPSLLPRAVGISTPGPPPSPEEAVEKFRAALPPSLNAHPRPPSGKNPLPRPGEPPAEGIASGRALPPGGGAPSSPRGGPGELTEAGASGRRARASLRLRRPPAAREDAEEEEETPPPRHAPSTRFLLGRVRRRPPPLRPSPPPALPRV